MLFSSRKAALRLALLFFASLLAPACERDQQVAPAPSAVVVEAVDPDSLSEGPLVVMGLRLPAGADIAGQNVSAASVRVPHTMEKVASCLRAHLDAAAVETGPQKTVFSQARPRSASAGPLLKIVAIRRLFGTELLINVVRDPARPAAPAPMKPSDDPKPGRSGEPAPPIQTGTPTSPPVPNNAAPPPKTPRKNE